MKILTVASPSWAQRVIGWVNTLSEHTDSSEIRVEWRTYPKLWQYDLARLYLPEIYGQCLYLDADVRVHGDLSAIPDFEPEADVLVCRNPRRRPEFNNGLLYLRRPLWREYRERLRPALWDARGWSDQKRRNVGLLAFNKMLQNDGIKVGVLPDKYGRMWWEQAPDAVTTHYCGDRGKQELEKGGG